MASTVALLWVLDRPVSDLANEPDELAKISLEQAHGTARRYAAPSQMRILVVGDRSKVEDGLKKVGAGPVVILDSMGQPVK
ncbi:MAG: hypothetical protein HY815_14625 [Candidatus Riflebacteria bacterium]|nr:hypothetical protein [Candidatus Riflebacteria bacterium]